MRIPLDYYRILGLPIQASAEQLHQAYRDRSVQLPRREYSSAAIMARKQLLEEAYAILSDSEQRSRYDASYFAHNYERDADNPVLTDSDRAEFLADAVEIHPSIEISDEQFVGALLILQELGEYELVLKLGRPYLSTNSVKVETGQIMEPDQISSDIVLTVTLACLELGREQWQQDKYEDAATSLEIGQDLLLREVLFPNVRSEIQADLYKLRPYRILELLARSEENVAERRLGLKLLQDILQERGGIDGTDDDGSGLSLDDFLRFIQQLRSYLTAAEQQSLFESESLRPSAVASYLAVYALIARGFAQHLPVLIRQAKLLLIRLNKRQDLSVEQAVCLLLLGQTEAASRALELSHDYETLAFIQEHSQGFPDLLPGLCFYSERWLQTEVFPHFRDLAQQQASLKVYFADEQVQAYLEALPIQVEATNDWRVTPHTYSDDPPALVSQSGSSSVYEGGVNSTRGTQTLTYRTAAVVGNATSSHAIAARNHTSASVTVIAGERNTTAQNPTASPDATAITQVRSQQRSRRRSRSLDGSSTKAIRNVLEAKTRLVLLMVAGTLGIVVLGFAVSQAYGWLRQTFLSAPMPKEQPRKVQLVTPPSSIPEPKREVLTDKLLNQETAEQVIQSWLSTKTAAFGPNHAINKLEQILVAPTLSHWQQLAQRDKADNRYRYYKHSLKVDSVQTSAAAPDKAQVEATVKEVAKLYEDGQLNRNFSYDENLRVRYNLVLKNGKWRIWEMKVLK